MSDPRPHQSPLRGRYLVHNPSWNAFLRVADTLLGAFVPRDRTAPTSGEPRRVLLAVGGHLGDAVIATTAVALVRRALPSAEIGIALGSWATAAIEGHPDLQWIHTVDHWKANRSGESLPRRWMRYRTTRRRALREIRTVGYDAAVDLYVHYPNMAGLLWRAGIPVRVGYTSGGYGPLYTHPVDWPDGNDHAAAHHARLLRVLLPSLGDVTPVRYELPPVPPEARRRAEVILGEAGLAGREYVVLHMGSGSRIREWPVARWRQLAERLAFEGHRLVFTGSGLHQARAVADVARELRGCVDLTNRLRWQEFVHVLAGADLVVSVETVAAHVAAGVGTPCVALWTGITRDGHWRPLAAEATVLTNRVPCAPCFRSRGCAAMTCIRDLSVDTVLATVQSRLARPRDVEPLPYQAQLDAARG